MSAPSVTRAEPKARGWPAWVCCAAVGCAALGAFEFDLAAEPHFADESAFISQAYFYDLWREGATNDTAWLEYMALDLPPLPKYLFGAALRWEGMRPPSRASAVQWYFDVNARFESPAMLAAARQACVAAGAVACMALFGLGLMLHGRRAGIVAAAILAICPLFRMHARRAMGDAPCEALVLLTACAGLWAWRSVLSGRWKLGRAAAASVLAGALGGLAVLAKLNGGLGLIVVAVWALLGALLPGSSLRIKATLLVGLVLNGATAFAAFTLMNPTMTARPAGPFPNAAMEELAARGLYGRASAIVNHRLVVSRAQREMFTQNALPDLPEKLRAVVVQGFGRFGPLGPSHSNSPIRYDWASDRFALVWFPLVMLSLAWALRRGLAEFREGRPPTAWAVAAQYAATFLTVWLYIPLAWDRYYLPLQAVGALLVAGAAVALYDRVRGSGVAPVDAQI